MKRIKKYMIWLLILSLSTAGCGGKEDMAEHPTEKNEVPGSVSVLGKAEYPEAVKKVSSMDPEYIAANGDWKQEAYEADQAAWQDVWARQRQAADGLAGELWAFNWKITAAALGMNHGENTVCSPANLYPALAMLAETADGESLEQLLALLGAGDLIQARERAARLWDSIYTDNGESAVLPANSLWLRDGLTVSDETVKLLAEAYYADVYAGAPSDAAYGKALQTWLDEKTGGRLQDVIADVEMDPEMVLSLASTLYFSGKWQDPFDAAETKPGTFYGASGEEQADYLYRHTQDSYYFFDRFDAIRLPFSGGNEMWLIRPDEGIAPEEIAADQQFALLMKDPYGAYEELSEHCSYSEIIMRIPKFDLTSDLELAPVLQELGVRDVFDPERADLSALFPEPLPSGEPIYLTEVRHAANVKIDEEGCVASAFTLEQLCGAALPQGTVEFTLDKPFLYLIRSSTGAVLFVGTVNTME